MLTLEARRAAPEDVTAVLFPDAIARATKSIWTRTTSALDISRPQGFRSQPAVNSTTAIETAVHPWRS